MQYKPGDKVLVNGKDARIVEFYGHNGAKVESIEGIQRVKLKDLTPAVEAVEVKKEKKETKTKVKEEDA